MQDGSLIEAIDSGTDWRTEMEVQNVHRALLARVAGRVAQRWGDAGTPGTLTFDLRGSGGQSFGAFLVGGMDVKITGARPVVVARC